LTTSSGPSTCIPKSPRPSERAGRSGRRAGRLAEQLREPDLEPGQDLAAVEGFGVAEDGDAFRRGVDEDAVVPRVDNSDLPDAGPEVVVEFFEDFDREVARAHDLDREVGHDLPGRGPRDGMVFGPTFVGNEGEIGATLKVGIGLNPE
jgi:hypothetical protein